MMDTTQSVNNRNQNQNQNNRNKKGRKRNRKNRNKNKTTEKNVNNVSTVNGDVIQNNECQNKIESKETFEANDNKINNNTYSPRPNKLINVSSSKSEIKRHSGSEYEEFHTPSCEYNPITTDTNNIHDYHKQWENLGNFDSCSSPEDSNNGNSRSPLRKINYHCNCQNKANGSLERIDDLNDDIPDAVVQNDSSSQFVDAKEYQSQEEDIILQSINFELNNENDKNKTEDEKYNEVQAFMNLDSVISFNDHNEEKCSDIEIQNMEIEPAKLKVDVQQPESKTKIKEPTNLKVDVQQPKSKPEIKESTKLKVDVQQLEFKPKIKESTKLKVDVQQPKSKPEIKESTILKVDVQQPESKPEIKESTILKVDVQQPESKPEIKESTILKVDVQQPESKSEIKDEINGDNKFSTTSISNTIKNDLIAEHDIIVQEPVNDSLVILKPKVKSVVEISIEPDKNKNPVSKPVKKSISFNIQETERKPKIPPKQPKKNKKVCITVDPDIKAQDTVDEVLEMKVVANCVSIEPVELKKVNKEAKIDVDKNLDVIKLDLVDKDKENDDNDDDTKSIQSELILSEDCLQDTIAFNGYHTLELPSRSEVTRPMQITVHKDSDSVPLQPMYEASITNVTSLSDESDKMKLDIDDKKSKKKQYFFKNIWKRFKKRKDKPKSPIKEQGEEKEQNEKEEKKSNSSKGSQSTLSDVIGAAELSDSNKSLRSFDLKKSNNETIDSAIQVKENKPLLSEKDVAENKPEEMPDDIRIETTLYIKDEKSNDSQSKQEKTEDEGDTDSIDLNAFYNARDSLIMDTVKIDNDEDNKVIVKNNNNIDPITIYADVLVTATPVKTTTAPAPVSTTNNTADLIDSDLIKKPVEVTCTNDDYLFPDAITPSKICAFDTEPYNVPYMDDSEFDNGNDGLYVGECKVLKILNNSIAPMASLETLFNSDPAAETSNKKPISPLSSFRGKKSLTHFLGCMGRSR